MSLESLFSALQKAALPGIWSKGVALSREGGIIQDSRDAAEIRLRVHLLNRPVSPRVTLWPGDEEEAGDEDWHCDCGDRNDPCLHIVAAAVALKNGTLQAAGDTPIASPSGAAAPPASAAAPASALGARIEYRFTRENGSLSFDRWIVRPDRPGTGERINGSLVSLVGGISSGRVAAPALAVTQEDFRVDRALNEQPRGVLARPQLASLLAALQDNHQVTLDGAPVRAASQSMGLQAQIVDEGPGFRLRKKEQSGVREVFRNGAALLAGPGGGADSKPTLRPIHDPQLSEEERVWITAPGRFFGQKELGILVNEILPALERKIPVEIASSRFPKTRKMPPRLTLRLEKLGNEGLSAAPTLVYGDPPVAWVQGDRMETLQAGEIPLRDRAAERELARGVQAELNLAVGQSTRFEGEAAVEFVQRARSWAQKAPGKASLEGSGLQAFRIAQALVPRLSADTAAFDLEFFEESDGETGRRIFAASSGAGDPARKADLARVFQAWREGRSFVPLFGGGWAPLPKDWLERYGSRIESLLAQRDSARKLPSFLLPAAADLCQELGQSVSESLRLLRSRLDDFHGIPPQPLPQGVRAQLRSYQLAGYHWLCFLRDNGMGALLADDMGLGKTLQALCAIRGRALVVCPTSVLDSWAGQVEQFRPGLRVCVYHGPSRQLDREADLTLTTYGILRLDREALTAVNWDTAILDEAQTIKNPESQIAQAAHRLRAGFRIALSGTPVENHLEDLWSQFRFLNPGLLGTRDEFQQRFSTPITRGDSGAARQLRQRIRPFLLRRLKTEVAPELPPRTELTLHCELGASEKDLYDALLASTRQEVLERLETGGGVFAALELLLRLRQACCHPALLPGQSASGSSKLELLLEQLTESIDAGHRSLVFSQWTSFLDLIEPRLQTAGISFSRLDGSTRDRDAVVRGFQDPTGPSVLLISLKAGGVGITLTAADHIYILDPWWNPAVEDQAADRAHRIGQENPVFIHRLVARGTVEDRILLLQKKKLALAKAALEDSAKAVSLTRDDLLELLQL